MTAEAKPIYLLPGMTAEYSIYGRLAPLLENAQIVRFIPPKEHESLTAYAARMADCFPVRGFIVGASFGGILALEISRIVHPAGCILISSIRHPSELPPWSLAFRLPGSRIVERILQLVGNAAALFPQSMSTGSTRRLAKLGGTRGAWHRWATTAVLRWNPSGGPDPFPVLQIHGDADTTFPIRYTRPDVVIRSGRHDLPVSHPSETAKSIMAFMERHSAGCEG